jgi:multisubunit Na+/H+ antiporter MnhG subunit
MEKLNLDRNSLKKFAIIMGTAFLVFSLIVFFKHKAGYFILGIVLVIFFVFAFIRPELLKPIYIVWMKFAFVLGWINTRIILIIVFYLVITPVGLLLKLFGKDILDIKIDKTKESYWIKKDKKQFSLQDYERQF